MTELDKLLEEFGAEEQSPSPNDDSFDSDLLELLGETEEKSATEGDIEEWAKIAAEAFIDECEKIASRKRTAAIYGGGAAAGAGLGAVGIPMYERLLKRRIKKLYTPEGLERIEKAVGDTVKARGELSRRIALLGKRFKKLQGLGKKRYLIGAGAGSAAALPMIAAIRALRKRRRRKR